jgi:hypothetical protein
MHGKFIQQSEEDSKIKNSEEQLAAAIFSQSAHAQISKAWVVSSFNADGLSLLR